MSAILSRKTMAVSKMILRMAMTGKMKVLEEISADV
jgi:hypothetical protein